MCITAALMYLFRSTCKFEKQSQNNSLLEFSNEAHNSLQNDALVSPRYAADCSSAPCKAICQSFARH